MQFDRVNVRSNARFSGFRLNREMLRRAAPVIMLGVVLALWQIIVMLEVYPRFIIPTPLDVLERLSEAVADGTLWTHTQVTLIEIVLGLAIGGSFGMMLGYFIAKSQLLEDLVSPLIVTMQSTPVVAYAPLLVIWFGSGVQSKIVTSALIVFFPILMSTIVGIREVPPSLRDLMRSLGATRWQFFIKLELPSAMCVMLNGLKVSATLAVIGAVVGEFVSANAGLGFLINVARNQYDTPMVLVAVITLALIARALYGVVALMERHALAWQKRVRR